MGTIYAAATVVAGLSGFPLSFLFYTATDQSIRGRLIPAATGFAALSLMWPCLTAIAFVRARQRRFTEHRAWMVRSYSLTAAAITARVFAFPLLLITRDPILAINLVMVFMAAESAVCRDAGAAERTTGGNSGIACSRARCAAIKIFRLGFVETSGFA